MEEDEQSTTVKGVTVVVGSDTIGGTDEEAAELHSVVVEQDLDQPDMCAVTVNNQGHTHSNDRKLGDSVEVKIVGDDDASTTIFKGELVALEPFYEAGGESKVVVRAFNRMHRLTRGRKSRTWKERTDQQIVDDIAQDANLSPDKGSSPSIQHPHIYQHNQTNLEFLRTRAARLGFKVWVEDQTLYFKKPDRSEDSGIELKFQSSEAGALQTFAPRLSSAGIVTEVKVRGWDPEKKELIEGSATPESSSLGSKKAASESSPFGSSVVTYEVDHPIFSKDEADAIAKARLDEISMDYITGEAACMGDVRLKPGIVIKITVNDENSSDRFNGKYLVVGTTHIYTHSKGEQGGGGGYRTIVRVRRDAEGG